MFRVKKKINRGSSDKELQIFQYTCSMKERAGVGEEQSWREKMEDERLAGQLSPTPAAQTQLSGANSHRVLGLKEPHQGRCKQ